MLPPPRKKMDPKDYEKVPTGDFVNAVIKEIKYDMEHTTEYQGKKKVGPAVRLIFQIDGCKFDHGTRWMSFGYGEKYNLFGKYVKKLVKGAVPDMKFDLDLLKGMKVKMVWSDDGDYQNIDLIKPAGKMLEAEFAAPIDADDTPEPEPEEPSASAAPDDIPF